MRNIVVIGGNAAGLSFAAKYRRNNNEDKITVLEKSDIISFGSCGLPYFVGNEFTDHNEMIVKTEFVGIEIIKNYEVKNIDTKKQIINDEINYDILVIASGASPINIYGGTNLTTLNDGFKVKENLNGKIAIIGGGFIGLELFDNLNETHDITLFEKEDQVLNNILNKDFADLLVHENIKLKSEFKNEDFDFVIECIGFRPNTSFIEIDKLPNGAIITDNTCKTSIDNIYAIGDCATIINKVSQEPMYVPLATTANKSGRFLADHLAGLNTTFSGMLGSWCLKTLGYEVAGTGISEAKAKELGLNYKVRVIKDKNHTSYCHNQEDITAQVIYDADTLEILGCQMIGKLDVVLRLNTIALAIDQKVKTNELGYVDFAYAPPFTRTWDFLNVIGNVCK